MSDHIAMVRVYCGGAMVRAGEVADYSGPPDWKYQPVDPAARAEWNMRTAQPERVARENRTPIGLGADNKQPALTVEPFGGYDRQYA